jgi:hypothetical protein
MADNKPYTLLDEKQTIRQSFDEANDAHRVVPLIGGEPLGPTNPFPTTALPFVWDYVSMALSGGNTTETYTFKTGGSGGTTVGTVTVVYTSSAREVLVSATIVAV